MADLMVGRPVSFDLDRSPAHFRDNVLSVDHLTVKNETGLEVVKDVSFQVRAGEIFAIAGVSGNGQTEIADAVTGMRRAASGSILLNGQDITGVSVERTRSGRRFLYSGGQARDGRHPGFFAQG